jgi:hypothetical protein
LEHQVLGLEIAQIVQLLAAVRKPNEQLPTVSKIHSRFKRNSYRIAELQQDTSFNHKHWDDGAKSKQKGELVRMNEGSKRQRSEDKDYNREVQKRQKLDFEFGRQYAGQSPANIQTAATPSYATSNLIPTYPSATSYHTSGEHSPVAPVSAPTLWSAQRTQQWSSRTVES